MGLRRSQNFVQFRYYSYNSIKCSGSGWLSSVESVNALTASSFDFLFDLNKNHTSNKEEHQRYESLYCSIFNINSHCRTDYINTINRLSSSRSKSSKHSYHTDLYSWEIMKTSGSLWIVQLSRRNPFSVSTLELSFFLPRIMQSIYAHN
jgi:hypothetical protein